MRPATTYAQGKKVVCNVANGVKAHQMRKPIAIGTWNVQTMRKDGKVEMIEWEMERLRL
jgi:hypothetical protein